LSTSKRRPAVILAALPGDDFILSHYSYNIDELGRFSKNSAFDMRKRTGALRPLLSFVVKQPKLLPG
jgi:hypothetical protein